MNSAPRLRLSQLPQLPALPKQWVRNNSNKRPRRPTTGFVGPEGHGEKIWIWSHRRSDQTIYTFRDQLDGFHDLKQLAFHGKKTKPAKLRKDYWSPMAIIKFGPGQGSVGRSVFHKLRELKHLHEVAWDPEFRQKTPGEYSEADEAAVKNAEAKGKAFAPIRTRKDRMVALNRQKANTVADMAAILAGQGKGNKVAVAGEGEGEPSLVGVTVSWANDLDRNHAVEWSQNVSHNLLADAVEEVAAVALETESKPEPAQPQLQ